MSELSTVMEKHDNPRKWREKHGGWVGNKRTHFPSLASFTLFAEKQDKVESAVNICILIMDGQKVVKINQNYK